eukprot:4633853-Alexandrium_andersonii.AAC.1
MLTRPTLGRRTLEPCVSRRMTRTGAWLSRVCHVQPTLGPVTSVDLTGRSRSRNRISTSRLSSSRVSTLPSTARSRSVGGG